MRETSKLLAHGTRLNCLSQFETQVSDDGQSFSARMNAYATFSKWVIRALNDCQSPDHCVSNCDKQLSRVP